MSNPTRTVNILDPRDLLADDRVEARHENGDVLVGTVTSVGRNPDHPVAEVQVGSLPAVILDFVPDRWHLVTAFRTLPAFERDTTGVGVLPNGNLVRGYIYEEAAALEGPRFISETGIIYDLDSFRDFKPSLPRFFGDADAALVGLWAQNNPTVTVEVEPLSADNFDPEKFVTAADVNSAAVTALTEKGKRPRSLYATGRPSYDAILTVSNLREQLKRANERITAARKRTGYHISTITFSSWPFEKLGPDTDVENLKDEVQHRVNMLNQQAQADAEQIRFSLDESDSGFRISARRSA